MMGYDAKNGNRIVLALVDAIHQNRDMLSEIDGLIGDGDHGVNMDKGFLLCKERIEGRELTVSEALEELGQILLGEIGGSMGPLYGTMFMTMAEKCEDSDEIGLETLYEMVGCATDEIQDIGGASAGDKTLIDVLLPAKEALQAALKAGDAFEEGLSAMEKAAQAGRDATVDMVAKLGRAARLGERSRGVPDAGATSCCLLLCALADAML